MSSAKKSIGLVLLSELIATYLFVFWIIMPFSFGFGQNENLASWWNTLYNFLFSTLIMKAAWVGVFLIGLLYVFRPISCNVNPAVTLAYVCAGKRKFFEGFLMMSVQFLSGFIASISVYYIASSNSVDWWQEGISTLSGVYPKINTNYPLLSTLGLGDINLSYLTMSNNSYKDILAILCTILEASATFALLWSIVCFKKVHHKYRPLAIAGVLIGCASIGLIFNTMSMNPARVLGPALVCQIYNGVNTINCTTLYLFAEFTAAILFIIVKKEKIF